MSQDFTARAEAIAARYAAEVVELGMEADEAVKEAGGTPPPDPPPTTETPPGVDPALWAAYHAHRRLPVRGAEILLPKRVTLQGIRYWPQDIRESVPISVDGQTMISNAPYHGWDLIRLPQGGGSHHKLKGDYVRLGLTTRCIVAVVLIGAGSGVHPAGFDAAGWERGASVRRQFRDNGRTTLEPVRTKVFDPGEALIPAMDRNANSNTADYYVIMVRADPITPALPAVLAGQVVPPPGSVVHLKHWLHDMHQIRSPDGAWHRSWHPQQDAVFGCFLNHDHRSDPADFLDGAWLPPDVAALIDPRPRWMATAGAYGASEELFGYKVLPGISPEDDCEIMFLMWWPTSTPARFRNPQTTLDIVVKRISTGEIVGVFSRYMSSNNVRWAFPDSGASSRHNLKIDGLIPDDWEAMQNVPVAVDGSGYWSTQYRFLAANDPLHGDVTLTVDDPLRKAVVRWAASGTPRPGGPAALKGEIVTNLDFMMPLREPDLAWFDVRGDTAHHAPRYPNPDNEFGTESWFILGGDKFIGVDTTRPLAFDGIIRVRALPEYAKPNTRLGITGDGRFAPTSHFFDSRYRRTPHGEPFERFDRNVGGVINSESTN